MPEKELEIIAKKKKEVKERLGTHLKALFTKTETLRQNSEEDVWMESMRQVKGIYDPDTLAKIKTGKSRVYPRYTRSKTQPCMAKLNNMLFPNNDRNFEIRSTPEPELQPDQIAEIVESLSAAEAEGQAPELTQADIDIAIKNYSDAAVKRMSSTIDDQLIETDYQTTAKKTIKSGVILGTGIFKGPLSRSKMKRTNTPTENGFTQTSKKIYRPHASPVSLWRWYPDMSSTDLASCEFVFELNGMTRHELRKLGKRKNFDKSAINKYIREHKTGDYKMRQWEIDLKIISDEENTVTLDTGKYQVLEYNGYLDGQDMLDMGILKEGDSADQDWFVNLWLLGNEIIRVIKHPIESLEDLYNIFYFDKDESSIFGEGLPRIIRDTQISICSATRAMLDNGAWVAGPVFEANEDLMPDEDLDDIYPGRVLGRSGEGAAAQYPALRVYNIESRISDYLAIINKFEQIGDMESTLPAALFGAAAKTTNETAKGVSIASSNTNLTINDIVKNFDQMNEKFLSNMYSWNMEYNENDAIKGDMEVKAIGSASLVAKEERTNAMSFFKQSLTPEDMPYVKKLNLLEASVKLMDLEAADVLHTQAEADKNIEAQQDTEMRQLQLAKMQSEVRYDDAKSSNMESKASETMEGIPMKQIESLINSLQALQGGKKDEAKPSPSS